MLILLFLLIIVFLFLLFNKKKESFTQDYYPHFYNSNEIPCNKPKTFNLSTINLSTV